VPPPKGNHLKLMVDYNLKDPEIVSKLNAIGALDVKTTIELGYAQDAKDPHLIWNATVKEDRILLTVSRRHFVRVGKSKTSYIRDSRQRGLIWQD